MKTTKKPPKKPETRFVGVNIPNSLYDRVKEVATFERRSLSQQIIVLLEESAELPEPKY